MLDPDIEEKRFYHLSRLIDFSSIKDKGAKDNVQYLYSMIRILKELIDEQINHKNKD
jgi:hypothetical protein